MALGISGLTCLPFRVVVEAAPRRAEGTSPVGPMEAIFQIAGLLLSALLVWGGYAAFRLHRRARPLLIGYAVASLIVGAASLALYALEMRRFRNGMIGRGGGVAFTYELVMWP